MTCGPRFKKAPDLDPADKVYLSLRVSDQQRLDRHVHALREAGRSEASRSMVVRLAIAALTEEQLLEHGVKKTG